MKKILFTLLTINFLPVALFAYTGQVLTSYDLPCSYPAGLTYDGKYIWLADRKDKKIYCIDPANGKVIRELPAPGYWSAGLAWDGKYFWNVDIKGGIPEAEREQGTIYKISPIDGTILNTIPAPSKNPKGLAWDGKYLWCTDTKDDEIIQFDPSDGTTIRSFKAPAQNSEGLAFDGKYLWVSDRIMDEIYMLDIESGCVIIITEAPGKYTNGLCFDGQFLWAVDYQDDKLYKISINDKDNFRKTNEHKAKVTYTHLTTNFGPGILKSLDVHLAIADDRDNQKIISEIKYFPKYTDIVTDKWGQKTAHYHIENIKPGNKYEIITASEVTTWDVRYFIFPDKAGKIEDIPAEIKNKYLENNDKYMIDHTIIQNAVKSAVGDEKNPYWIARKLYNYIITKMEYEMVGGWNTAPTVLARGTGSCSEYAFVYIALCRAAGIPARYVGSVVIRGDDASMDDVFHRWAEIYLPNYGWIPIDPSGGDYKSPREQADSFGALVNRFYITTQSGGNSETLGWTYNSNEFWISEPKTFVVHENFADWEPVKENK